MWLVADPCGRQYACLVQCLLAAANAAFCFGILLPSLGADARKWIFVHQATYILTVWSHLVCMLTDPGAVPLNGDPTPPPSPSQAESGDGRWCKVCQQTKPPRAHHCSECQRCILKMDHHCMLMNNCVGAYNQKHFLLFLVYLLLHCLTMAGLVLASVAICHPQMLADAAHAWPPFAVDAQGESPASTVADNSSCHPYEAQVPLSLALAALALGVANHARSLLREQVDNLRENRTYIDKLQGTRGEQQALRDTLAEVMGGAASWRWLLPLPVRRAHPNNSA